MCLTKGDRNRFVSDRNEPWHWSGRRRTCGRSCQHNRMEWRVQGRRWEWSRVEFCARCCDQLVALREPKFKRNYVGTTGLIVGPSQQWWSKNAMSCAQSDCCLVGGKKSCAGSSSIFSTWRTIMNDCLWWFGSNAEFDWIHTDTKQECHVLRHSSVQSCHKDHQFQSGQEKFGKEEKNEQSFPKKMSRYDHGQPKETSWQNTKCRQYTSHVTVSLMQWTRTHCCTSHCMAQVLVHASSHPHRHPCVWFDRLFSSFLFTLFSSVCLSCLFSSSSSAWTLDLHFFLFPCGLHRGNIPLALRQMRSLALWPMTRFSQGMSPTSLTISTTQRLLKSSSPGTRRTRGDICVQMNRVSLHSARVHQEPWSVWNRKN